MNDRRAKQLRKDSEVVIILDRKLAQWLQGFFTIILSTMDIGDINNDTINARQVVQAIKKGIDDGASEETTDSTDTSIA